MHIRISLDRIKRNEIDSSRAIDIECFFTHEWVRQQRCGKILHMNRTTSKDATQGSYLAKGQETRGKRRIQGLKLDLVIWKRQAARDGKSPNLICLQRMP